jgi:hypothetical protein
VLREPWPVPIFTIALQVTTHDIGGRVVQVIRENPYIRERRTDFLWRCLW